MQEKGCYCGTKKVITAEKKLDRIWQPMRVCQQRGGIGLSPSKDETGIEKA